MNLAINLADIRSALRAIEFHTFGASEDEAIERDAHLFHVLEDVRNIQRMLKDFDKVAGTPPTEIGELAGALQTRARQ